MDARNTSIQRCCGQGDFERRRKIDAKIPHPTILSRGWGIRTGSSELENFQQKIITANADKFERARIWRCRGQGVCECRRTNDAMLGWWIQKGARHAARKIFEITKESKIHFRKYHQNYVACYVIFCIFTSHPIFTEPRFLSNSLETFD